MSNQNQLLNKYLERRKKQGTVILCFKVLLENAIANGSSATMTKIEINREFDKKHRDYGVGTFRSDYLLRQSSKSDLNAIGVQSDNTTFFIRPEFLEGLDSDDLVNVSQGIEDFFKEVVSKQQALIQQIASVLELSIEERKSFILDMLLRKETEKKGQAFEVTAYSILRTFYEVRGFELNRFSTVYSNDGGIDFTSQTAVYQVTTNLSNRKFEEDLEKAPLKNRVFVYKSEGSGFDQSKFNDDLVLDYISSDDLVNHLEYLVGKRPEKNTKIIIETIMKEFEREYYL